MNIRASISVVIALATGVILGLSVRSEPGVNIPSQEVQSVSSCSSQVTQTLKPTSMDLSLLHGISDLCYTQAYSQAQLHDFQIRRLKFVQQTYDERILLWMVVAITMAGVGLAALQLLTSYTLSKSGMPGGNESSEFVLEKDRIALKSSVTGLFVLLFSFAFFYVFVYEIYVIKEIPAHAANQDGAQGETKSMQIPGSDRLIQPEQNARGVRAK